MWSLMVMKDATPLTTRLLAHERDSVFKFKHHSIHDRRGPHVGLINKKLYYQYSVYNFNVFVEPRLCKIIIIILPMCNISSYSSCANNLLDVLKLSYFKHIRNTHRFICLSFINITRLLGRGWCESHSRCHLANIMRYIRPLRLLLDFIKQFYGLMS